eukprot:2429861-Rhodomonas_salina.2
MGFPNCYINSVDNNVYCWQTGGTQPQLVPMPPGRYALSVRAGGQQQAACAVLDDFTVQCWGSNARTLLGVWSGSIGGTATNTPRALGGKHAVPSSL